MIFKLIQAVCRVCVLKTSHVCFSLTGKFMQVHVPSAATGNIHVTVMCGFAAIPTNKLSPSASTLQLHFNIQKVILEKR